LSSWHLSTAESPHSFHDHPTGGRGRASVVSWVKRIVYVLGAILFVLVAAAFVLVR